MTDDEPARGPAYKGQLVAAEQTQRWLPTNRKERFYTGTVLPMLIAGDAFAHLGRFLALCGLTGIEVDARRDGSAPCQLLTEYGFAESLMSITDPRWEVKRRPRDTPDVVLVGEGWLVAVEAKMFDRPTRAELDEQLAAQHALVAEWVDVLAVPPDRVRHIALLPRPLAKEISPVSAPVVTWESVVEAYRVVGPPYWVGVLAHALDQWPSLRAPDRRFGANAQEWLTGAEIVSLSAEDARAHSWMGRKGGLDGDLLAADISTGRWRGHRYEVRGTELPGNANWFSIEAFRARVEGTPPDATAP